MVTCEPPRLAAKVGHAARVRREVAALKRARAALPDVTPAIERPPVALDSQFAGLQARRRRPSRGALGLFRPAGGGFVHVLLRSNAARPAGGRRRV